MRSVIECLWWSWRSAAMVCAMSIAAAAQVSVGTIGISGATVLFGALVGLGLGASALSRRRSRNSQRFTTGCEGLTDAARLGNEPAPNRAGNPFRATPIRAGQESFACDGMCTDPVAARPRFRRPQRAARSWSPWVKPSPT